MQSLQRTWLQLVQKILISLFEWMGQLKVRGVVWEALFIDFFGSMNVFISWLQVLRCLLWASLQKLHKL